MLEKEGQSYSVKNIAHYTADQTGKVPDHLGQSG